MLKNLKKDLKEVRQNFFYKYNLQLQQAIEESIIFNCLYDAIEDSKKIESLHAILTDEDFKENFDFMIIKSNKKLLLDMIDSKIEKFQACMLETDKVYNKLKNIACYIDNRLSQIK